MKCIQKITKRTSTHWQWYKDFFHLAVFRYLITWFALVPIFAKILSKVPRNVKIETAENFLLEITLSLPFHWQLLWLSSLSFVFAFVLYKIFCPGFIIKYPNYNSYLKYNHSPRWIVWESVEIIKKNNDVPKFIERLEKKEYLKQVEYNEIEETRATVEKNQTVLKFNYQSKTYSLALPIIINHKIAESSTAIAEKEIFWEIFGRFASSQYIVRFCIYVLLIISLLLFTWVLLENIITGLEYFLNWI